jgi:hypothetical protein
MSMDYNNKNLVLHESKRKCSGNSDQSPEVANALFVNDLKRMTNSVSSKVEKKNVK